MCYGVIGESSDLACMLKIYYLFLNSGNNIEDTANIWLFS